MKIAAIPNPLVLLLLLAILAPSLAQAQSGAGAARRIFELTNQDRQAQGLEPLRWNEALATAAQAHADRMVREPELSHQYPGESDLMTRGAHAGAHFQSIAENVALGPSAEAIEEEWMHSTAHRTNILDPRMNALGVGIAVRNGSLYAVEDFAEAAKVLSREQAAQQVRALLRARNIDASMPAGPAEQACQTDRIPQGARSMVRFQTPDLRELPSQVIQQIRSGHFSKAAVGACAPELSQSAFTTYRVAILLY